MRLCSIQNLSALENVLRIGAMAMLCTTETQIEEIWKKEKPEAQAEARGNIEKQHPKKSLTMPLYDSKAIAEIAFLRRFTSIPKALLVFSSWSFAQPELQFPFSSSLVGFAALCKLRYGPPFDCEVKGGPWPLASWCRGNGH